MLLLTTLEAWRADAADDGRPFAIEDAPTAWAVDDRHALTAADAEFPSGQVVAVTLGPSRAAGPPGGAERPPRVIDRGEVTMLRYARRGPDGRHVALLTRPGTAEALDLLPHPEGGWFRETWSTSARFRPAGYPGDRAAATGIYFLLPAGEESMWHVVRSDEMWLWHRGGPLTLLLGGTGDAPPTTSGDVRSLTLGPAVEAGERPQVLVPAGVWQAARPASGQEVLVSCVVSPGFDFADFRTPPGHGEGDAPVSFG